MTQALLAVSALSTSIVALIALRVLWTSRRTPTSEAHKLYRDKDGVATEGSQRQYFYFVRIAKFLLLAIWAVGLSVSLGASIARTAGFLFLPLFVLVLERRPLEIFYSSLANAFAVTLIALCLLLNSAFSRWNSSSSDGYDISFALDAVQFGAAIISMLLCALLKRRPDVYIGGHAVDRQYTTSLFGRWTFSWISGLLAFAKAEKGLDLEHLPKLHLNVRSGYLHDQISGLGEQRHLWKTLVLVHYKEALFQTLFTVAQAAVQFIPSYALYGLLNLLEQRSAGGSVDRASSMETWLFWIVWARLGALIRSELSAMIFTKATRRKDVKHVSKVKASEASTSGLSQSLELNQPINEPHKDGSSIKTDQEELDHGEDMQKSRQATINLVGVDTKRVADFTTYYYLFPLTATKLIVSILFLVQMIGWRAVLAGFAVFIISLPLNIYASRAYGDNQGKLMNVRDRKMVVITEALQGIRQIKFSALERQWQSTIAETRSEELTKQWTLFCLDATLSFIWILGPVMLSAVALAVYALLYGNLGPAVAFTTITVFAQIELALAVVPELVADALEAWVSVKRIDTFLRAPEREEYIRPAPEITLEDASIAWPSDDTNTDRFALRKVNVRFPKHKLSVISGQTGSGKSLLLAAIIGEADRLSGTVKVPKAPPANERHDFKANRSDWLIDSAIAFVSQLSFVENASVKENILFGLPYDAGRYKKVLSACALTKDLDMLEDGDNTDIGANGINLSGGQKWRLSFARALYSRAGILVLDDIFSAVDAHVGRLLFEEALTGELGVSRTRILVTHHIELCLPATDYAVLLADGAVRHAGFVEDLQHTGLFGQISKETHQGESSESDNDQADIEDGYDMNTDLSKTLMKVRTTESTVDEAKPKSQPKKFTEDEKRETGAIKVSIYKEYLGTSGGVWYTPYASNGLDSPTVSTNHTNKNATLAFYLGIYVGISVAICVFGVLRYFFVYMGSLNASRHLFEKLSYTVLRAPLRWLDTVPVGRILNRFTADFVVVDSRLGKDLGFLLYHLVQLIGIIVAGIFVSPFMLLFALVLLALCVFVATHYLAGAREVKRLESTCKSPIFEQFGSVLSGLGTIRAFDKVDLYVERMFNRIDEHARSFWYLWLFNRWLTVRLNAIGVCFTVVVAAIIAGTDGIDASLAGFALSFALQYSNAIIWAIRQYASVELAMNATERIVEYSNIPIEDQNGQGVPAAWPTEGRLEVDGLVAGYAPDLPPILKGLSFTVAKNERVGVVGRTGAGKSSLTLALFRFLSAREGSIYIDNIDIAKIKLEDLRSRLAIIPQDPVLFSGTVRSNLDAFDERTDSELFDALERVHLIRTARPASRQELASEVTANSDTAIDSNTNMFDSLSSPISEGGLNLSQGQRQLLCLARAIVSRPKIMVLDEATSAVDMATDFLIQRSIREEFRDSTLLVIAHRLSTVADFDKILVMADGKVAEFDTPKALLEKRGMFHDMVQQSGEKWRLEQIIGEGQVTTQLP
ncbi:MAG: hypothetical protein Q9191_004481 [Dirinaria sp. TL-2023a]